MIRGYKELLAEIEIHNNLLDAHRTSYKYYQKIAENWKPKEVGAMNYSGMPKGSSIDLDAGIVFSKAIHHSNRIKEEKEIIEELNSKRIALNELIKGKDTKEAVEVLDSIGMKQKDIAEFLCICERHVRRVLHELRNSL